MSRVWVGVVLVPVTSAEDGSTTHLVRFRLYEEGLISGEGRYAALCGKKILAGSMSEPPGRDCSLCRAAASRSVEDRPRS